MDYKLEVAVVPVSDVNRAKGFCQGFVQEITTRLPERATSALAAYDSVSGLADALRRAAAADGKHEEEIGKPDPDWPDWHARYMASEPAGKDSAQ